MPYGCGGRWDTAVFVRDGSRSIEFFTNTAALRRSNLPNRYCRALQAGGARWQWAIWPGWASYFLLALGSARTLIRAAGEHARAGAKPMPNTAAVLLVEPNEEVATLLVEAVSLRAADLEMTLARTLVEALAALEAQ